MANQVLTTAEIESLAAEITDKVGISRQAAKDRIQKYLSGILTKEALFAPSRQKRTSSQKSRKTQKTTLKGSTPIKSFEFDDFEKDIKEFSDKNEFGKRGPLLPTYEKTLSIIQFLWEKHGRFPKSPIVVKTAKGSPRVCMKHYNRIYEEYAKDGLEANELRKEKEELKIKIEQLTQALKESYGYNAEHLDAIEPEFREDIQKCMFNEYVFRIVETSKKLQAVPKDEFFERTHEQLLQKMSKTIDALYIVKKLFEELE